MSRVPARHGLPYTSHPLYKLRRTTLLTAILGFILNLLAIASLTYTNSGRIPIFLFSLFLLAVSFSFVLHDLFSYAARHTSGPIASPPRPLDSSDQPSWPSRRLILTDLVLAILFLWLFWGAFFEIARSCYSCYGRSETLEAYANLANLALCMEHAVAFWKEMLARKKAAWRRDLEARPCQNCGHVDQVAERDAVGPLPDAEPEVVEAGPSKPSLFERFGGGKVALPRWATGMGAGKGGVGDGEADDGAQEPLLVTPDESSTEVPTESQYGALEQSVQSVGSVPETVVKKKDKGKKRVIEVD